MASNEKVTILKNHFELNPWWVAERFRFELVSGTGAILTVVKTLIQKSIHHQWEKKRNSEPQKPFSQNVFSFVINSGCSKHRESQKLWSEVVTFRVCRIYKR